MIRSRTHFLLVLLLWVGVGFVLPAAWAGTQGILSDKEWRWENPWPVGNTLRSVWVESEDTYYLGGDRGVVLRYQGGRWTLWNTGTQASIYGIWSADSSSVFAVGGEGTILHFDGSRWTPMENPATGYELTGIWGESDRNVFAVGRLQKEGSFEGIVLHYDGSRWTKEDVGLRDFGLQGIWGTAGGTLWAVGFHYANQGLRGLILAFDGSQWSVSSSGTYSPLYSIGGTPWGEIYAVGSNGTVLHLEGSSWTAVTFDPSLSDIGWSEFRKVCVGPDGSLALLDIWQNRILCLEKDRWFWISIPQGFTAQTLKGTVPSELSAFGSEGRMFRYEKGVWTDLSYVKTDRNLNDVHGNGKRDIYAVGDSGIVLHYDGSTWFAMDTGTDADLLGVWHAPWNATYVVGSGGTILENQGDLNWTRMASRVEENLNAVCGIREDKLFAVGDHGVLLRYAAGRWFRVPVGLARDVNLNDVWAEESGRAFVVGDAGTILKYNGLYWTYLDSGTDSDLRMIGGPERLSPQTFLVAAGDDGTVLIFREEQWIPLSPPTQHRVVAFFSDFKTELYILDDTGDAFSFDGVQWTKQSAPIEGGIRAAWINGNEGMYVVGDHGLIAALAPPLLDRGPTVTLRTDRSSYQAVDRMTAVVSVENRDKPVRIAFWAQLATPLPFTQTYSLTPGGWSEEGAPLFEDVFLQSGFHFQGTLLSIPIPSSSPPIDQPGTYVLSVTLYNAETGTLLGAPSVVTFQVR